MLPHEVVRRVDYIPHNRGIACGDVAIFCALSRRCGGRNGGGDADWDDQAEKGKSPLLPEDPILAQIAVAIHLIGQFAVYALVARKGAV